MNKEQFFETFMLAIQQAKENAEKILGRSVPNKFKFKLYGIGCSGDLLDLEGILELIYIDDENFYKLIDLMVVEITDSVTTLFLRVSDHRTTSWNQTWNSHDGNGPFKQLIPAEIVVKK